MQAVYTVLREAEYRSTFPIAYWNLPGAMALVPRQRRCVEALRVVGAMRRFYPFFLFLCFHPSGPYHRSNLLGQQCWVSVFRVEKYD